MTSGTDSVSSRPSKSIAFEVPGVPQPQGSTRSFARGGKVVTTSDNKNLRPWRDAIVWHARQARGAEPPIVGAAIVYLNFYMPRPAGHYGSGRNAGKLRPAAPAYPSRKPDLDKLIRATLDALTEARVWEDDARVVRVVAEKLFDSAPRVEVHVEPRRDD